MNGSRENDADKSNEPLALTGKDVGMILTECGIPPSAVTTFERKYEESIGEQIPAETLTANKLVIKAQDIVVQAKTEQAETVEIRKINGKNYLLIPVEDVIEVNGVNIKAL